MALLLLAAPVLGFLTAPTAVPVACADTPDEMVRMFTGGESCTSLAAAGWCDSADDVVKKLMTTHCRGACGECGGHEHGRSLAFVQELSATAGDGARRSPEPAPSDEP